MEKSFGLRFVKTQSAGDTAANANPSGSLWRQHRCCSISMLAWLIESVHATTTLAVVIFRSFFYLKSILTGEGNITAAPVSSSTNRERPNPPEAVWIWINRTKTGFCACRILRLELADLYFKVDKMIY